MSRDGLTERVIGFLLTLGITEFEALNVDYVAREFGVNRSYLSTRFGRDTGFSLKDYIAFLKILRSISVLEGTNEMTIEDLSVLMGFSRAEYFINFFKNKVGTTPAKYREYFRKARPLLMLAER